MTETQIRNKVVATAKAWIGCNEADGSHKQIVDVYNSHKPLARGYALKYSDAWCAGFVSAVAIRCNLTDIMPPEVGVGNMIELYRKLGRWMESDSYAPKPGDIIMYAWGDNGVGDCISGASHVGVVVSCDGKTITAIEGNKNNAVEYRDLAVNGRYIRGFGLPDYGSKAAEADAPAPTPDSGNSGKLNVAVGEIVSFKGGRHYSSANAASGSDVKASLAKVTAVYKTGKHPVHLRAVNDDGAFVSGVYGWVDTGSYTKKATAGTVASADDLNVGDIVNFAGGTHYTSANAASGSAVKASKAKVTAKYNGKHPIHLRAVNDSGAYISGVYGWVDLSTITVDGSTPAKKSIDEIAREVIQGKWGNGAERRCKLESAGYDYAAVQKRVNELLG